MPGLAPPPRPADEADDPLLRHALSTAAAFSAAVVGVPPGPERDQLAACVVTGLITTALDISTDKSRVAAFLMQRLLVAAGEHGLRPEPDASSTVLH